MARRAAQLDCPDPGAQARNLRHAVKLVRIERFSGDGERVRGFCDEMTRLPSSYDQKKTPRRVSSLPLVYLVTCSGSLECGTSG